MPGVMIGLLLLATTASGANRTTHKKTVSHKETISKIRVAKYTWLDGVRVEYKVPKKIDGSDVEKHELYFYKADRMNDRPGRFMPLEPANYKVYEKNMKVMEGHGKGHIDLDFADVLGHPDAKLTRGQFVKVVHVVRGKGGKVLNVDTATRDTQEQTRGERLRFNDWVAVDGD